MSYTPLHIHTEYSLLDGAIRVKPLVKYLKQVGIKSCSITDHGWCAGAVAFYKECKKGGIKPLLGVEAYTTLDPDGQDKTNKDLWHRDNMHMVLLAKDNEGWSGILQLASEAALDNFYYKPRIYLPKLERLSGHVVATSACLGGVLSKNLWFKEDHYGRVQKCVDESNLAADMADQLASYFPGDFYLELQDWEDGTNKNTAFIQYLLQLGEKTGLPFVITSDAHYITKEDHKTHELLMAMQLKISVEEYRNDISQFKYGNYFYVKTPEEMLESARHLGREDAYHNTNKIADKCNVSLTLGKYQIPEFNITEMEDYDDFLNWHKERNTRSTG